jgi:hypothetical protein
MAAGVIFGILTCLTPFDGCMFGFRMYRGFVLLKQRDRYGDREALRQGLSPSGAHAGVLCMRVRHDQGLNHFLNCPQAKGFGDYTPTPTALFVSELMT